MTGTVEAAIGALSEARNLLASLTTRIAEIEAERARTLAWPPHVEDIITAFLRGLDAAASSFEQRLGWHLNDANATHPGMASHVGNAAAQVLTLPMLKPSWAGLFPPSGLGADQAPLDLAAVTYFLRDRIEAEIPALVRRLCPAAAAGMKQVDRVAALDALNAQLAPLVEERDTLIANLDAARYAIGTTVAPVASEGGEA